MLVSKTMTTHPTRQDKPLTWCKGADCGALANVSKCMHSFCWKARLKLSLECGVERLLLTCLATLSEEAWQKYSAKESKAPSEVKAEMAWGCVGEEERREKASAQQHSVSLTAHAKRMFDVD